MHIERFCGQHSLRTLSINSQMYLNFAEGWGCSRSLTGQQILNHSACLQPLHLNSAAASEMAGRWAGFTVRHTISSDGGGASAVIASRGILRIP